MAYFSECEMYEVFPIRRPQNYEQFARIIQDFVGAKVLLSGLAKQAMKLVNCNHGSCGIVDCRRQSFEGDVDHNTECKSRILLHRPLWPERHSRPQSFITHRCSVSVQVEQWLVGRNKVADLWNKFDDAARLPRRGN